jgi:hypothetical protein
MAQLKEPPADTRVKPPSGLSSWPDWFDPAHKRLIVLDGARVKVACINSGHGLAFRVSE